MAKSSVPKGKLVRKFGENIFGNPKYDSLLNKKPYTPGQHGPTRRRRLSNYGVQLREKQKNQSHVWRIGTPIQKLFPQSGKNEW